MCRPQDGSRNPRAITDASLFGLILCPLDKLATQTVGQRGDALNNQCRERIIDCCTGKGKPGPLLFIDEDGSRSTVDRPERHQQVLSTRNILSEQSSRNRTFLRFDLRELFTVQIDCLVTFFKVGESLPWF